tara:strand:+ start:538 stop:1422 length:885 start_codon:yes stop_codon:yes gene_type:complete
MKKIIDINNSKTNAVIKIKLADDCKNGHQDFSITATFYEPNKRRTDRNLLTAGCCHDEILKAMPELKMFVDLHLCDYEGSPMYAIENGFFNLSNLTKEKYINYFNITAEQYEELKKAKDKLYFAELIMQLGIKTSWGKRAKAAIKTLEKMTNTKFINTSTKRNFKQLTAEQKEEISQKIKEGFYSAENIEKREEQKKQDKKDKTIKDLKETAKKAIEKINIELSIKMYVLSQGYCIENVIYYDHTNKLKFNWLDYKDKISESEFNYFVENVDFNKLPNGITFELENVKQYAPTR